MKCSGGTSPKVGWRQRISASAPISRWVVQADFRLVVQEQFFALDGAAQFVLQRHALVGLGGEVAGVAFDAVAALGLGAVHRGIGVFDQGGDVVAVLRIQAGADAGADKELVLAGLERWGEAVEQFIGQVFGIAGLLQAGQQDDEFVAAQARHGVDVAQLLLEAHGDVLEQQVADGVAEAVVDVLEAVQVEEQHGALVAVFLLAVKAACSRLSNRVRLGRPVSGS